MSTSRPRKRLRWRPPEAETRSTDCTTPFESERTNAIVLPSGDQAGLESKGPLVRRRTFPPLAGTTKIRAEPNAIDLPVGDQTGANPSRARNRRWVPSLPTAQIPRCDRRSPEKAMRLPSGDQVGGSESRLATRPRGVRRRRRWPRAVIRKRPRLVSPGAERSLQKARSLPSGDHVAPPAPPPGLRTSARWAEPST
jgi:hypothetical protein